MKEVLRYALIADGTSDIVLKDIIEWALLRSGRVASGEFFARPSLRGKKLDEHIR